MELDSGEANARMISFARSDPQIPLSNLSELSRKMDSLQQFLARSVDRHTLLGKDQMDMVSSEITSAIHQIFVNGAALLSSSCQKPSLMSLGSQVSASSDGGSGAVDRAGEVRIGGSSVGLGPDLGGGAARLSSLADRTARSSYPLVEQSKEFADARNRRSNVLDFRSSSTMNQVLTHEKVICGGDFVNDEDSDKVLEAGVYVDRADPVVDLRVRSSFPILKDSSSDVMNCSLDVLDFRSSTTMNSFLMSSEKVKDGGDVMEEEMEKEIDDGECEIVEIDAVDLLAEHIHICDICGKGFKRDANLRMHMRAHGNKFKTHEALAKPLPDRLSLESSNSRRIRFSCPFEGCNRNKRHKKFRPLKSALCVKNHFKRSHCPKMYSCHICNKKTFSVVADLKSHLRHCGESKWRCSCGTTFSRKDKLFGHMALFEGHMPAVTDEDDEKLKGAALGRGAYGGQLHGQLGCRASIVDGTYEAQGRVAADESARALMALFARRGARAGTSSKGNGGKVAAAMLPIVQPFREVICLFGGCGKAAMALSIVFVGGTCAARRRPDCWSLRVRLSRLCAQWGAGLEGALTLAVGAQTGRLSGLFSPINACEWQR